MNPADVVSWHHLLRRTLVRSEQCSSHNPAITCNRRTNYKL